MNNLLPDNDDVLVFKHSQEGGSGWGEVVLNRPGRKNAIVGPLGRGLTDGIRLLDRDEDVQAIVLSGAGAAFVRVWTWPRSMTCLSLNGWRIFQRSGAKPIGRCSSARHPLLAPWSDMRSMAVRRLPSHAIIWWSAKRLFCRLAKCRLVWRHRTTWPG